jgi:chromosome partitioning protein
MSRVIAVANQKGGVAKTTSVVSLGAAFQQHGLRVLLVDLDPQSSLTFSLGIDPDQVETSIADVLLGETDLIATRQISEEGMDVIPATIDLAGVEAMLLPVENREFILRRALEEVASSYDVILLDCSPSLGLLTINALAAADEVIVPLQCEMLSHRGVGQLLDTVSDVHRLLNPRLKVRGLLPTMYDGRSVHSRAVLADIGERYELPVLPPIPRSVRFAEAPGMGGSILKTARRSAGAAAYLDVAEKLIDAWKVAVPKRRASRKKPVVAPVVAPVAAKRPAAAKSAAKRPAAKKSVAQKTAVQKTAVQRAAVQKTAVQKTGAQKSAVQGSAAKKPVAVKTSAAAKKTPAKRTATAAEATKRASR